MNFLEKIIWKMLKKKIYRNYIKQKEIRQLPLIEIKKIQWNRLKDLLYYVEKNSSYYKHVFESNNINIDKIKSYEDFRKIPVINKKILIKYYNDIKKKGCTENDYVISNTSGSTGIPFPVLLDKERESVKTLAAYILNREHVGIEPFKKQNELMLKIFPVNEIDDFQTEIKRGFTQRIKSLFVSETFGIKSTNINIENLDNIHSLMKKQKISGIYGYSSNVFSLANLFKKRKIQLDLKYVILIAEGIKDQQKKLISEVFNCPVFMDYGASECMRMGFECKTCNGYHMDIYNYFFEYLDDEDNPCKPGQEANIVITNLNNHIFPLIRYKIRDRCITPKNNCSCGLNFPIVPRITGRKSGSLTISKDKQIPLMNLHIAIDDFYDYIFQYKIIIFQKKSYILIKLIPLKKIPQEIIEKIREKMLVLVENSLEVNVEVVESIPFDDTGKSEPIELRQ